MVILRKFQVKYLFMIPVFFLFLLIGCTLQNESLSDKQSEFINFDSSDDSVCTQIEDDFFIYTNKKIVSGINYSNLLTYMDTKNPIFWYKEIRSHYDITLTYSFEGDLSINDFSNEQIRTAFRKSISNWGNAAFIDFVEVSGNSNITIRKVNSSKPNPAWCNVLSQGLYIASIGYQFRIVKADIELNASNIDSSYTYDNIESIFLHETGHALGLAHEHQRNESNYTYDQGYDGSPYGPYDPYSIMHYDNSYSNRLSIGDISAISYMYGGNIKIKLFDINGDKRSDLIIIGPKLKTWISYSDSYGKFAINRTNSTWSIELNTGSLGDLYELFFADLNGDGKADLLQTGNDLGSWIGMNDGNGNIKLWTSSITTGRYGGTYQHYLADLNGDGRADFIQTGNGLDTWIGMNDGNGNIKLWTSSIATGRYGGNYQHYFADLNGDGRADLIQTGNGLDTWIGMNDGNGNIKLWTTSIATGRYGGNYQHYFADLNGDGRADLIQTGNGLDTWIGMNDGKGNIKLWTTSIATGRYGGNYQHYFADLNGDGRADLFQTGTGLASWISINVNGILPLWTY